jgi:hypothetical protein
MRRLILLLTLLALGWVDLVAQHARTQVFVVSNHTEVKEELRSYHIRFTTLFTPTTELALKPSSHLSNYLQSQIRTEKDTRRLRPLKEIASLADQYIWYCAGFTRNSKKLLFCVLVGREEASSIPGTQKSGPGPHFPIIFDGGTRICQAVFDPSSNSFILLRWNGEG